MAVSLIASAFRAEVPSVSKLVLLALADSANDDDGGCWFLMKTLCAKTSLSERCVREHLGNLERVGYLRREFRPGRSTVFFLSLDKLGVEPRVSRGGVDVSTPAPGAAPFLGTPARRAGTPAPGAPTPAPGASTPAPGAPISVSYPVLYPLTNPPEVGRAKNALPGSRNPEAGTRSPEGLARGGAGAPDPEPEYPPEHRREMIRRLRESVRGIGS